MRVRSLIQWSVFVTAFLLVQCASTSGVKTLDASYFQRDGVYQYATSNSNRRSSFVEELGDEVAASTTTSGGMQIAGLRDSPQSQCACEDIKVCPGMPVPKPYGSGSLATTPQVNRPPVRGDHNRFYYLRSCDKSPEDLAFFIFGDRSRAAELVASVGGEANWRAGRVVSYRSPKAPADDNIASFYQDHPPIAKQYTVKRGDTLASIAYKVYGDSRNWREIALDNAIARPDQLTRGQVLTLSYKE